MERIDYDYDGDYDDDDEQEQEHECRIEFISIPDEVPGSRLNPDQ